MCIRVTNLFCKLIWRFSLVGTNLVAVEYSEKLKVGGKKKSSLVEYLRVYK